MAHAWNGCSQSSRFPTAGQGERSSGNEIGNWMENIQKWLEGFRPIVQRSDPKPNYFFHTRVKTTPLSPGQTIATCQRNISQHCWAQHVACVWPPFCTMLRHVGCCWLKFDQFQTGANNTQHVVTHLVLCISFKFWFWCSIKSLVLRSWIYMIPNAYWIICRYF